MIIGLNFSVYFPLKQETKDEVMRFFMSCLASSNVSYVYMRNLIS